jgi:hypothetical protein
MIGWSDRAPRAAGQPSSSSPPTPRRSCSPEPHYCGTATSPLDPARLTPAARPGTPPPRGPAGRRAPVGSRRARARTAQITPICVGSASRNLVSPSDQNGGSRARYPDGDHLPWPHARHARPGPAEWRADLASTTSRTRTGGVTRPLSFGAFGSCSSSSAGDGMQPHRLISVPVRAGQVTYSPSHHERCSPQFGRHARRPVRVSPASPAVRRALGLDPGLPHLTCRVPTESVRPGPRPLPGLTCARYSAASRHVTRYPCRWRCAVSIGVMPRQARWWGRMCVTGRVQLQMPVVERAREVTRGRPGQRCPGSPRGSLGFGGRLFQEAAGLP